MSDHKRRVSDRIKVAEGADEIAQAAEAVAEAASIAAQRVADAARSASESAASAAAAQTTAAQVLGAVTASRLDGMEKRMDKHEIVCGERYTALGGWIKTTFFTMLSSLLAGTGSLIWFVLAHR